MTSRSWLFGNSLAISLFTLGVNFEQTSHCRDTNNIWDSLSIKTSLVAESGWDDIRVARDSMKSQGICWILFLSMASNSARWRSRWPAPLPRRLNSSIFVGLKSTASETDNLVNPWSHSTRSSEGNSLGLSLKNPFDMTTATKWGDFVTSSFCNTSKSSGKETWSESK